MTAEQLEIVSNLLTEVARTLAVVAIAQRLSEASTEEEKMFLSQALSALISNFQGLGQRLGGNPHQQQPFGNQHMY
jgi:hypothetical protein